MVASVNVAEKQKMNTTTGTVANVNVAEKSNMIGSMRNTNRHRERKSYGTVQRLK